MSSLTMAEPMYPVAPVMSTRMVELLEMEMADPCPMPRDIGARRAPARARREHGRAGWRRTAALNRRGEDRGHPGARRKRHLSTRPYPAPGGGSNSVLYWGASAFAVAMKAACASAPSGGGACVRVATGWPTRVKNSSCPEGAHMHSNRDGLSAALVNACGALAGTLMVWPARATSVSPLKVIRTPP